MSTTNNIPPSDLNPEGEICIPLTIPNDWEWLWTVHKALSIPSLQRYWQDDSTEKRDIMRYAWESRVAVPFAQNIIDGVLCVPDEQQGSLGECFRMDTTTEVFSFYPNDPFTDSQNNEGVKLATPLKWQRWGDAGVNGLPYAGELIEDILGDITGYFPNDIMLTLDTLNPFDNPISRIADIFTGITSFWFPTVFVELEGEGQFEIELINVPYGGSALLIPNLDLSLDALLNFIVEYLDGDEALPATWVLAELNRDIISFPPEIVATNVFEFQFTGDTRHTMHVVFIPRINDELPFLFPFGGVREIEACGSLRIVGSQTGEIIDRFNYGLQQHSRSGFIMSTVSDICEGVVCAFEEVSGRIIQAQANNIKNAVEVGLNGDIAVKDSGIISVAPDITAIAPEILNGATYKVAQEVNNFVLQIAEWHSLGKTQAYVNSRLPLLYDITDPTTAVANFYTNIGANAIVTDNDNLSAYLYCEGINKQAVAIHAINHFSANEIVEELYLELIDLLTQGQLNTWSSEGQNAPRTEYFAYPCHPKDTYKFKWLPSYAGTQASFSIPQYDPSSARLIRIEASGVVTGANGELLDMKSWVSTGGSVSLANWQFETFPTARSLRPPIDIGYKDDHIYKYTVEIPAGNYPTVLWQLDTQHFNMATATGEINVNMIDLGEA